MLKICGKARKTTRKWGQNGGLYDIILLTCLASIIVLPGCRSPEDYHSEADKVAYDIIKDKQTEAIGRQEGFTIARPSDIFRRRLLESQDLLTTGPWSYGIDKLEKPEHWIEDGYHEKVDLDPIVVLEDNQPVIITLLDALQIGAQNSFDYQQNKEGIFTRALDLDMQRNNFRALFTESYTSSISTSGSGSSRSTSARNSLETGLTKNFTNGLGFTASLAVDLANLLTAGGASSLGLRTDPSISMPLLRGSGEHIITEDLTQAERNVMYEIWGFERSKRTYAVSIANEYLGVLRQLDQIKNEEGNYKRSILLSRRSKRLADAGQIDIIEVDQAVQNELSARSRWIQAIQSYEQSLDSFKQTLGLPTDAKIELERRELDKLYEGTCKAIIDQVSAEMSADDEAEVAADPNEIEGVAADDPITLEKPDYVNAGPYELDPTLASQLALENRYDLMELQAIVYDRQRAVIIAADDLGAELTIGGSIPGGSRASSGTEEDSRIRWNEMSKSALLRLDLPIERTRERNNYRKSLINLQSALRSVQSREDLIKLDVRNRLRTLLSTRESVKIQAMSVKVAEKRVDMAEISLEAGRAKMRDILEAQDALVQAQNSLTRSVISYRVSELQLQSDMGLLEVNEKGLWKEFDPKEYNNAEEKQ